MRGVEQTGKHLAPRDANLFESDDRELVRALVARDPQAPVVLWRRYAPLVFCLLRRELGRRHDLEDLSQEVFLCILDRVATLREPNALKGFITTITVLTSRGELKRSSRRRRLQPVADGELASAVTVHVDTDAREAVRRFYGVLARINPRDRLLFMLRFIEDISVRDVAAVFGRSEATIKRRLARVWSRVRLLVERDPVISSYLPGGCRLLSQRGSNCDAS